MASVSLFNLSAGTTLASGDILVFCDISDTTQSANGSDLKITLTNFFAGIPVPVNVTSASAVALAVGRLGATTPAFTVDASTASQVAGLKVTGAATGGTVAVVATDSGSNTNVTINAKGSGTIGIGTVSTGLTTIGTALAVTGATTLAALSATTGAFSGAVTAATTLGVTGATTLAALSATTGSFSSTLGVTGAATLSSTLTIGGLTYTFPASQTANRFLKTDGSGTLSWATILEQIALTDLSDVTITSQATGQILRASSASAWANSTATFPDTATAGHLLYASASNVWSGLTIGAANTVLLSTGSAPSWVAQSTLTAPAGLLTGTTLASNVVTSSLTAIGTLASGAVPASLVTAGTFGSGSYTFPGALTLSDTSAALTLGSSAGSPNIKHGGTAGRLILDGDSGGNGGEILLYGSTHSSLSNQIIYNANTHTWKTVSGTTQLTLTSSAATFAGTLAITGALTGVTTLTTSGAINGQTISSAASFTGTLAVTGTTTLSGEVTLGVASATPLTMNGQTSGASYVRFINTSGFVIAGTDGSTPVISGGNSYEGFVGTNTARSFNILYNGNVRATINSGGMAVTGTLAVSGNLTANGFSLLSRAAVGDIAARVVNTNAGDGYGLEVWAGTAATSSNYILYLADGSNNQKFLFRSNGTADFASNLSIGGTLAVTGTTVTVTGASGYANLHLGNTTGGEQKLKFFPGSAFYAWMIAAQTNVSNGLEFTPSTAVGGSTFSTPTFYLTPGAATFSGTLSIGSTGSGITYTSSGGSGLRIYGSSGTHQWDQYLSGGNLRFSDNTGGGVVAIDTGATIGGTLAVGTSTLGDSFSVFQFPGTSVGLTLRDSLDTSGAYFQAFRNSAGTIIGSVNRVGTTSAVIYNTTSDYRQKKNPQALIGSGDFIDALQPKTWEWLSDGSRGTGFLAHEFAQVSPSSVMGEKDAVDAVGNPIYQGMQASTSEVIAHMVAELQSLRLRVAQCEA